jgi:hypothetical protein
VSKSEKTSSELIAVVLSFVEFGMLKFDVLLQRALGAVATVAELRTAVVFAFDLLGSPPCALVSPPLGVVFGFFRFVLEFLESFGAVEGGELRLGYR